MKDASAMLLPFFEITIDIWELNISTIRLTKLRVFGMIFDLPRPFESTMTALFPYTSIEFGTAIPLPFGSARVFGIPSLC